MLYELGGISCSVQEIFLLVWFDAVPWLQKSGNKNPDHFCPVSGALFEKTFVVFSSRIEIWEND